jgi:hypothetical protein
MPHFCGLYFHDGNHAASGGQRQAASQTRRSLALFRAFRIFRKAEWTPVEWGLLLPWLPSLGAAASDG